MSDDFMRNTDAPISPECEMVDARLADYLDDAPDPAVVAEVDAHLADCARCAALVADLTGIASAARRLPALAPSRDLWSGIAERIDAAPVVVPIETARRATRGYGMPARWLAAAAAALVIATAGLTYVVTRNVITGGSSAGHQVASEDATRPTGAVTGPAASPKEYVSTDPHKPPPTGNDPLRNGESTEPESNRRVRQVSDKHTTAPVKVGYDLEIDRLRRIVRERRSDLDSSTVAVLDRNLRVIDEAIAQSRAALAHDPRSRFLDEQLNRALDKKIELLRTAALLPART